MRKLFRRPASPAPPPRARYALAGVLLAGLLLAAAPAIFAALRCDICGGPITGRYYEFGDRNVCLGCYQSLERCEACGIPIPANRGNAAAAGHRLCDRCRQTVRCCANCGEPILGKYYTSANAGEGAPRYCEHCMQTKPRCSACNLPARNLRKVSGGLVCPACEAAAERCAACGDPILTKWYRFPGSDEVYCDVCYERTPHCDLCNRPVGLSGRRLADGRLTCAECRKSSVDTIDRATDLLAITVRYLEEDLGLKVEEPFDFALVDNRQIARLCGRKQAEGVHELGLFNSRLLPESPRPIVLILSDLPVSAFLETAAHEYAHLWQYTVNPHLSDERLREGFAQWVAAKWLAHCNLEQPLRRLAARSDDPYGTGYQIAADWEIQRGAGDFIEHIASVGRFGSESAVRARPDRSRGARSGGVVDLQPLHRLLSAESLSGENAFLREAQAIDPTRLRLRPTHGARRLLPVSSTASASTVSPRTPSTGSVTGR